MMSQTSGAFSATSAEPHQQGLALGIYADHLEADLRLNDSLTTAATNRNNRNESSWLKNVFSMRRLREWTSDPPIELAA